MIVMTEEIIKLRNEAELNLQSLNVEYMVYISNDTEIRFFKDGYLIYIDKVGDFTDKLTINFRLLIDSRFLKKRKILKYIEKIDYITELLIGLSNEIRNTDNITT